MHIFGSVTVGVVGFGQFRYNVGPFFGQAVSHRMRCIFKKCSVIFMLLLH